MTKENIEILPYNKIDENFAKLIELHQLISKHNKLTNHLIYYDTNFPLYFEKIVINSNDLVFTLKLNGILDGFIHFKLFNDTIFLNNICLSENCQGKGLGKTFLKESLNLLNLADFNHFALDVFTSNQVAFSWYKNLGLEESKSMIWKQILPKNHKLKKNSEITFKKDLNNFNSLFYKDDKIATLINNSTMLIHDLTFINQITPNNYMLITNQNTQLLTESNYELINLENSKRLEGKLSTVLNKLNA